MIPDNASRKWLARSRRILVVIMAAMSVLLGTSASVATAQDEGTPPPLAGESDTSLPCFDGRLRIRDLEGADASIPAGLQRVYEVGKAWEPDATLFSLRLGCPLLETGYQLEGTFFSKSAQAFFATDTGAIQAAEDDPNSIPILDTSKGIQVLFVYRSLVQAGFNEDSLLGALGGVTIRPSTEAQPFGPQTAPKGDVYFHVSILERGEVVDVWVASNDGNIYRYPSE